MGAPNVYDLMARATSGLSSAIAGMIRYGLVTQAQAAAMPTLTAQLEGDEIRSGVPLLEPYGLAAAPHPGAEVAILAIGGDGENMAICAPSPAHRPPDLGVGDVGIYTHADAAGGAGHRVALFVDGRRVVVEGDEIVLKSGANSLTLTPAGLVIRGPVDFLES